MKCMKSSWATALLIVTLASVTSSHRANASSTPPPRGHAYGYFLKGGVQVLFTYCDADGSRLIELSHCHPQNQYIVEFSENLITWSVLTTLTAQWDGTASYAHTPSLAMCFYRVKPAK